MDNSIFTIKQARNYKGYSQREMAGKLRMSLPTYREKEEHPGRFRVDELMAFLDIVGMNKDNLIFLHQNDTKSVVLTTQKGE